MSNFGGVVSHYGLDKNPRKNLAEFVNLPFRCVVAFKE